MPLIEYYRTELKRLAWRLHYHVKKEQNNEALYNFETFLSIPNFSKESESNLFMSQLLNSLSSTMGKEIIYRLFILEEKEKEVAEALQITQQAVNRWKRKMLQEMKGKIENWSN
ncbi:hypothetical protein RE92_24930 (plasmid) [Paenibacillus polymyxa]|nr:hypothetical protein RE92_24930 [Paenibacillus polymyxa]